MNVLLAIEDCKFSEAATRSLASRADLRDAQVVVLEVVEPLVFGVPPQVAPGYLPKLAAHEQEQLKQANATVKHAAELLHKAGFKHVEPRVVEGDVRTSILNTAAESHADLIMVGSHGRKGLQNFLLGSVAESVARHAPCSVTIVRDAAKK